MLNTSCPVCSTAVMSKAGRFHCPGCDVPVMTEAEAEFMAKENAKNGGDGKYSSEPSGPPVEKRSLEEEKKAYDRNKKTSAINTMSAKIGEHLLLGYTLLGEACPRNGCGGLPLMQRKVVVVAHALVLIST
jgi:uncharacterized Zn finger protein (UPF0148 family)